MRWTEEVDILQREMARVLAFHEWEVAEWSRRAGMADSDGLRAYALRQAGLRTQRRNWCVHVWRNVAGYVRMSDAALENGDNEPETTLLDDEAEEALSDFEGGI